MSPNRIVAFLTPLVFAPMAGVISTWAAENLPGVNVPASAVEEIFIAGALIALAPAVQWLHGWQKHEERAAAADAIAVAAATVAPPIVEAPPPQEPAADELDDLDLEELDELDDFDEFEEAAVGEDETVTVGS